MPNASSRAGVKYFGAGDLNGPSLANEGSRRYELDIGGVKRSANVNVVAVRKPLLAMCDLVDKGHAVHFTAKGCWIEHEASGERIPVHRRGGKFEIDAKVSVPSSGFAWPASAL